MTNVFAELRAKYLVLPRPLRPPVPRTPTEPWGIVMEVGYPSATVTTVTFADGTVSVLRSTGDGFFGGGDAGVQAAGRAFLKQAQRCERQMNLTIAFPEPEIGQAVFYARTDTGVYGAAAAVEAVQFQRHPLHRLYSAGLQILREYLRLEKLAQS